jgi:hypothetical protein
MGESKMKKFTMSLMTIAAAICALFMTVFTEQANAQINSPVPGNAFIVYGGLDWAWGGPCPYSGGCFATGDLTYQGTLGWRLPSAAELAIVDALDGSVAGSPQAATFANLFLNNPGGNVPPYGTDPVSGAFFPSGSPTAGSCATPYFSGSATWCDRGDGLSGLWAGSQIGASDAYYAEQLYVRSIPEASTWAMMLIGFVSLGFAGYRRAKIDRRAFDA